MAEQAVTVESLQEQLRARDAEIARLQAEVKDLRSRLVNQAELQEQHGKLMQRVRELSREKEMLAVNVEQEEEMLTNTLQKKLERLRRDKVDLENQLETEQEYITNRLHKHLRAVIEEKEQLESRWEAHTKQLLGQIQQTETMAKAEKIALQTQLEAEEENLTNRLVKQMDDLKAKQENFRKESESYKERNQAMRQNLEKLRAENYALKMKIAREEEHARHLMAEKVLITSQMEMESERQFNLVQKVASPEMYHRDRSFSEPVLTEGLPSVPSLRLFAMHGSPLVSAPHSPRSRSSSQSDITRALRSGSVQPPSPHLRPSPRSVPLMGLNIPPATTTAAGGAAVPGSQITPRSQTTTPRSIGSALTPRTTTSSSTQHTAPLALSSAASHVSSASPPPPHHT